MIAEHREVLGQRVRRPRIAQHTDERDEHGDEQNNQSHDDEHGGPLILMADPE